MSKIFVRKFQSSYVDTFFAARYCFVQDGQLLSLDEIDLGYCWLTGRGERVEINPTINTDTNRISFLCDGKDFMSKKITLHICYKLKGESKYQHFTQVFYTSNKTTSNDSEKRNKRFRI